MYRGPKAIGPKKMTKTRSSYTFRQRNKNFVKN